MVPAGSVLDPGVRAWRRRSSQLDGSASASLSLVTGLSTEEINEFGGLPPERA
jgi:hypothetical protein